MFPDFSPTLAQMCGTQPVSAEDAPGLREAVRLLIEGHDCSDRPQPEYRTVSYEALLPAN